jgi:hypothetical protein
MRISTATISEIRRARSSRFRYDGKGETQVR